MVIKQAEFISSITDIRSLPRDGRPEFAFIGRSNVGKSSLINMITNRKQLAKTSSSPGKTQTINHYLVNKSWYLVDLPGYGYASVSKATKKGFGKIIDNYLRSGTHLYCLFILVDLRLEPQPIDLQFINWVGGQQIPIAILFTKADKLSSSKGTEKRRDFERDLLKTWSELPPGFITSATTKKGKADVLTFIEKALRQPQND
jgi:GTP-binding protein